MAPARWGPPDRPYHRAIWHGTRSEPGDRPDPGVHPALLAISESEVLAAAAEVTAAAPQISDDPIRTARVATPANNQAT
jgi:hypothetical protein